MKTVRKPKRIKSTVPKRLGALGKLFAKRSAVYGRDYITVGKVFVGFFPDGIVLDSEEAFRTFYLLCFMISKINRYVKCVGRGETHEDSLNDLSVYSQMVAELDEESGK